jgi:hypothetical protein
VSRRLTEREMHLLRGVVSDGTAYMRDLAEADKETLAMALADLGYVHIERGVIRPTKKGKRKV